jgi:hypothetical protein
MKSFTNTKSKVTEVDGLQYLVDLNVSNVFIVIGKRFTWTKKQVTRPSNGEHGIFLQMISETGKNIPPFPNHIKNVPGVP